MYEVRGRVSPKTGAANAYVETFFRCLETVNPDGSGSMVDIVRGATYQPSASAGGTLVNGSTPTNSLSPDAAAGASVVLTAGTWPNFRQRSVMTFAFGRLVDRDSARTPIGNGSSSAQADYDLSQGGNISLSCAGRAHMVVSGATGVLAYHALNMGEAWDMPPNGTDVGLVLEYQPAAHGGAILHGKMLDTNGNVFDFGTSPRTDEDGTTTYVPTTMTNTGSGFTATGDVNPGLNNKTRIEGMALYGFAAFSFPGSLPSREVMDAAYLEMMTDWIAGRRVPPSQFRYVTQIP